jgi:ketosteroid isomerase-like protein
MFERYTEKARRVIFFGRYEASQLGSHYIETEHLLLSLLREDKALANRFLIDSAAIEDIRKQIEDHTTVREKVSTSVDLPLTHECKRVLAYGAEEAERLNHKHIGTGHLLLGLLREEKSFAAEILHERGLRISTVREEIARSSFATATEASNVEIARQYLKIIEEGATGEALAKFFDPEVIQTEFPNRITPKGAKRDLQALFDNAQKRQQVMSSQTYTILHEVVAGNFIIFEVLWEGTLAVPFQSISPGQTMRAHFAIFLKFRNGKIIEQRNYDCFDPFPGE